MEIDKYLPMTKYGRPPCTECTLKHLGTAWFLLDNTPQSPEVLLERVKILLNEADNGYPSHRYLAIGVLNFMEPYSPNPAEARRIRRAINSKEQVDLTLYPLPKTVPTPSYESYKAHLIEARHESPIELDNLSIPILVEKIMELL